MAKTPQRTPAKPAHRSTIPGTTASQAAAAAAAPPRPAVTSLERERTRPVDSTVQTAGQRRAERARVLADVSAQGGRLKVVATQAGYYDHARRREGDVFTISDETYPEDIKSADGKKIRHHKGDVMAFSSRWMRYVDGDAPESMTSSNEVIREKHDEILALRQGGMHVPVGDAGVEDTGDNPIDGD